MSTLGNMKSIRGLVRSDIRNASRDSTSVFMIAYPFILAVVLRWLIPVATAGLSARFNIDLSQYNPLIVTFFGLLIMPQLFGSILGFLLLDERDDNTLTALQVTPLSTASFFGYRLLQPAILTILATLLTVPLLNIYDISIWRLLPIALVMAMGAPIYGLMLASLANNKVQGLAILKGLGIFLLGPMLAWFVAEPWASLFGIFPNYWPAKAFWLLLEGQTYWGYLLVGILVSVVWIVLLFRNFQRVIYK